MDDIMNFKRVYPFSYKYFENHDCQFWPCHKDTKDGHNCMFCRCVLYKEPNCPGIQENKAKWVSDGKVKDCSNCTWNHKFENAEALTLYYKMD